MKMLVLFCCISIAVAARHSLAQPTSQPKEQALEHLAAGERLYELRKFEDAIKEFEAGALIVNLPVFSYNLGQCYRQLGNYQAAIWHFDRYLVRGSDLQHKKEAARFIAEMRAELDRKARTTPPLETLRKENHPDPAVPRKEDQPTRAALNQPALTSQPTTPGVQDHTRGTQGPHWYTDAWGWGLSGAGLLTAGTAAWLFTSAVDLDRDANVEPVQETQDELRAKADARRILGVVAGVGSAALIVTGIVKLASTDPRDRPTATTATHRRLSTSWALGITTYGFALAGRF